MTLNELLRECSCCGSQVGTVCADLIAISMLGDLYRCWFTGLPPDLGTGDPVFFAGDSFDTDPACAVPNAPWTLTFLGDFNVPEWEIRDSLGTLILGYTGAVQDPSNITGTADWLMIDVLWPAACADA